MLMCERGSSLVMSNGLAEIDIGQSGQGEFQHTRVTATPAVEGFRFEAIDVELVPFGVTLFEGADAGPVPIPLVAVTVKV